MKLISVFLLIGISWASYGDTCIPAQEKSKLLELSYGKFDQSLGEGWRKFSKPGCYAEVALLIDEYFNRKQGKLESWQSQMLTWHSGQLYAFDNNYEIAKNRFRSSLDPKEPKNEILWNDYVQASIAFLDNDLRLLKKHRDKIATGPTVDGKKPNLWVVNNFIRCFGKPYSVAYSSCPEFILPKVTFRYSRIYDQTCSKKYGYVIEDDWIKELDKRLPEFIKSWKDQGEKLFKTTFNILGTGSRKNEFHANFTLCDFPSISHPLLINMRYYLNSFTDNAQSTDVFVSLVHHEILHDYLLGKKPKKSIYLEKYKSESPRTLGHIHLLALQKAVYLELDWHERLKKIVEKDSNMPPYKRAWDIINFEDYMAIVRELTAN